MYCPRCGTQIPEGSNFCPRCGAAFIRAPAVPPRPAGAVQNSGMAVASLVLGIAGFIIPPSSILAIIFGAVAMSQNSKNPNFRGKNMAVVGLALGIAATILWIILVVCLVSIDWAVDSNYY